MKRNFSAEYTRVLPQLLVSLSVPFLFFWCENRPLTNYESLGKTLEFSVLPCFLFFCEGPFFWKIVFLKVNKTFSPTPTQILTSVSALFLEHSPRTKCNCKMASKNWKIQTCFFLVLPDLVLWGCVLRFFLKISYSSKQFFCWTSLP